jgi:hypothetical protein
MNLRQAAQQALEALESIYDDKRIMVPREQDKAMNTAIDALCAALAEPEQEPYTWRKVTYDQLMEEVRNRGHEIRNAKITAPTPRKPLTDEELLTIYTNHVNDEKWGYERAIERAHGIGEEK